MPNTKNTPHGHVFRVWQGGEGRGDTWACLASQWMGRLEGGGRRLGGEGEGSRRKPETRPHGRASDFREVESRPTPKTSPHGCVLGVGLEGMGRVEKPTSALTVGQGWSKTPHRHIKTRGGGVVGTGRQCRCQTEKTRHTGRVFSVRHLHCLPVPTTPPPRVSMRRWGVFDHPCPTVVSKHETEGFCSVF